MRTTQIVVLDVRASRTAAATFPALVSVPIDREPDTRHTLRVKVHPTFSSDLSNFRAAQQKYDSFIEFHQKLLFFTIKCFVFLARKPSQHRHRRNWQAACPLTLTIQRVTQSPQNKFPLGASRVSKRKLFSIYSSCRITLSRQPHGVQFPGRPRDY